MKILFVCSGNICRSPMAEEYARQRASQCGMSHLVVESAGTLGIEGASASAEAVQAMAELGFDLSSHRSRGLRSEDLRTADLVLAMDHRHLEEIARRFRPGDTPVRLLRAFESGPDPAPGAPDLADPIGSPVAVYRKRLQEIIDSVDNLLIYLRHGGWND